MVKCTHACAPSPTGGLPSIAAPVVVFLTYGALAFVTVQIGPFLGCCGVVEGWAGATFGGGEVRLPILGVGGGGLAASWGVSSYSAWVGLQLETSPVCSTPSVLASRCHTLSVTVSISGRGHHQWHPCAHMCLSAGMGGLPVSSCPPVSDQNNQALLVGTTRERSCWSVSLGVAPRILAPSIHPTIHPPPLGGWGVYLCTAGPSWP